MNPSGESDQGMRARSCNGSPNDTMLRPLQIGDGVTSPLSSVDQQNPQQCSDAPRTPSTNNSCSSNLQVSTAIPLIPSRVDNTPIPLLLPDNNVVKEAAISTAPIFIVDLDFDSSPDRIVRHARLPMAEESLHIPISESSEASTRDWRQPDVLSSSPRTVHLDEVTTSRPPRDQVVAPFAPKISLIPLDNDKRCSEYKGDAAMASPSDMEIDVVGDEPGIPVGLEAQSVHESSSHTSTELGPIFCPELYGDDMPDLTRATIGRPDQSDTSCTIQHGPSQESAIVSLPIIETQPSTKFGDENVVRSSKSNTPTPIFIPDLDDTCPLSPIQHVHSALVMNRLPYQRTGDLQSPIDLDDKLVFSRSNNSDFGEELGRGLFSNEGMSDGQPMPHWSHRWRNFPLKKLTYGQSEYCIASLRKITREDMSKEEMNLDWVDEELQSQHFSPPVRTKRCKYNAPLLTLPQAVQSPPSSPGDLFTPMVHIHYMIIWTLIMLTYLLGHTTAI